MDPCDVRVLAEQYSQDAPTYREHWAPILRPLGLHLVDGLDLAGATRVLDLGSGVGTLLPAIGERAPGASVIGVDRALGMLALAPAVWPRAVMDAARLAFDDGVFDAVIAAFMLFHLPDPAQGLREVARVLVRRGQLGLATWDAAISCRAMDEWEDELDAHGAVEVERIARHELMDSPEKVTALLEAAGFAEVRTEILPTSDAIDLDEFILRRTRLGGCKRRFDSLDAAARPTFLARARARLERLAPDDFVDRSQAILTWARRA